MDRWARWTGTALVGLLAMAASGSGEGAKEAGVRCGSLAEWRATKGIEGLEAAFAFLEAADLEALPLGRTVIDGEDLFAIVSEAETRAAEDGRFEAHRVYIDVQLVVSGQETIGYAPVAALETVEAYDPERDIEFFATPAESAPLALRAGRFAVFAPGEGHMPGLNLDGPHKVRKVVVKMSVVARDRKGPAQPSS